MTIKISKTSRQVVTGEPLDAAMVALAQQTARTAVAGVSALTDNSGGTDSTVTLAAPIAEATAASGSNLADKTEAEAAIATVTDAAAELAAKLNAYAAIVGYTASTDSTGGTAADGTVGAVTKTVAGASTGIQLTEVNAYIAASNKWLSELTAKANQLFSAVGLSTVNEWRAEGAVAPTLNDTLDAPPANLGTAAGTGVTKAEFDAVLLSQANAVKTIATALARVASTSGLLVRII